MEKSIKVLVWATGVIAFLLIEPANATVRIEKNLAHAYKRLKLGNFETAIIIAPFITIEREIEQALGSMPASSKTRLFIIAPEYNANRLLARLPQEALRAQKIIIRTTDQPVHEKVILLFNDEMQHMDAYFGSANPTYNQFRNIELVLSLTDISDLLYSKFYISHALSHTKTPSRDVRSAKRTTPNRVRIGRLAELLTSPHRKKTRVALTELVTPPAGDRGRRQLKETPKHPTLLSSFMQPLIPFILDRIQANQTCSYKIATMTLNHPALVSTIEHSIRTSGSIFKLIVDEKTSWHIKNPESTLYALRQLERKYPDKIQIKKHTGTGYIGIFHAKLFLRQPMKRGSACKPLAIPGSMNLTVQSGGDSNLLLIFPDSRENKSTIKQLGREFDAWWEAARNIR